MPPHLGRGHPGQRKHRGALAGQDQRVAAELAHVQHDGRRLGRAASQLSRVRRPQRPGQPGQRADLGQRLVPGRGQLLPPFAAAPGRLPGRQPGRGPSRQPSLGPSRQPGGVAVGRGVAAQLLGQLGQLAVQRWRCVAHLVEAAAQPQLLGPQHGTTAIQHSQRPWRVAARGQGAGRGVRGEPGQPGQLRLPRRPRQAMPDDELQQVHRRLIGLGRGGPVSRGGGPDGPRDGRVEPALPRRTGQPGRGAEPSHRVAQVGWFPVPLPAHDQRAGQVVQAAGQRGLVGAGRGDRGPAQLDRGLEVFLVAGQLRAQPVGQPGTRQRHPPLLVTVREAAGRGLAHLHRLVQIGGLPGLAVAQLQGQPEAGQVTGPLRILGRHDPDALAAMLDGLVEIGHLTGVPVPDLLRDAQPDQVGPVPRRVGPAGRCGGDGAPELDRLIQVGHVMRLLVPGPQRDSKVCLQ